MRPPRPASAVEQGKADRGKATPATQARLVDPDEACQTRQAPPILCMIFARGQKRRIPKTIFSPCAAPKSAVYRPHQLCCIEDTTRLQVPSWRRFALRNLQRVRESGTGETASAGAVGTSYAESPFRLFSRRADCAL